MKVAVYYNQRDIRIEERPVPKIGQDEVLVEMKACGICGSDLMEWYQTSKAPVVLGHEPAGIIVEIGKNVEKFETGDRVFVHHHVACLSCHYCIRQDYTLCEQFTKTNLEPGGFAEYFRVPSSNLKLDTLKIPEKLSFEEATLIEPVACCLRALSKCNIQTGDTVAIIGAGPAGIINVMLSRLFGISKIIVADFVDYRLEVARKLGADLVVNVKDENLVEAVKASTNRLGADFTIVTAPSIKAYSEAMKLLRKGGTLCVFASTMPNQFLKVSPKMLFFSEIKIVPSYSTSHIETRKALQLIESGRIDVKALITHRFPLNRIREAFKLAVEGKSCLKIVIVNQ
jgi:L-iditol 2-dehydrogenase